MEYLPLLNIMENKVYRASDLEDILLSSKKSSKEIAEMTGYKLKFIYLVAQGKHKNELISNKIIESILEVL